MCSFSFQKRLLAYNTFEVHRTKPVKKLLKEMRTDDALIPGGCTKYIRASDELIGISPSKAALSNFMMNGWLLVSTITPKQESLHCNV